MEQTDFFNLLPDLTLEEVFQAYYECRQKKRGTRSALRFEMHYEHNLHNLWQDIVQRRYHITPSSTFIVTSPVMREIFAATFKDRIVHHLVIGRLLGIFENLFIDYSYSCRSGKGTLYAVRSVEKMMKECSMYYTQDCYVLRLDIQGYFFHINKRILKEKLHKIVNEKYFATNRGAILYLLDEILANNPVSQCRFHSPKKMWQDLPKSKSLFFSKKDCGLPIGNLTSQIFANLYLNDFDHYVSEMDKDLYYGRYVDDMILIHPSREFLLKAKDDIENYLETNLDLKLHPKKISLQHYKKGFLFVGAYIKPNRIYPGKRLQKSFYKRMQALNKRWETQPENKYDKKLVLETLSSINSYFGLLKHYDAWRVKLKGWNMLSQRIRNMFSADMDFKKVTLNADIRKKILEDSRRLLRPAWAKRKIG